MDLRYALHTSKTRDRQPGHKGATRKVEEAPAVDNFSISDVARDISTPFAESAIRKGDDVLEHTYRSKSHEAIPLASRCETRPGDVLETESVNGS